MKRRRRALMALLCGAAVFLAACAGAGTTEAPAPTPSPHATLAPTPSPEAALLEFPSARCCRGQAVDPGRYRLPAWLGIPLAIEIGEGWRVLNESAARLFLLGRGENVQGNPSQMIAFLNVTGQASPEEVIEAVSAAPELTALAEPASVEVAGFSGQQLDSAARPNPDYAGNPSADIPPGVQLLPVFSQYFTPGFTWSTSSPEARVRTIGLAAGEATLLLYLEAPPDAFEGFASEADTLLQSLRLIEP